MRWVGLDKSVGMLSPSSKTCSPTRSSPSIPTGAPASADSPSGRKSGGGPRHSTRLLTLRLALRLPGRLSGKELNESGRPRPSPFLPVGLTCEQAGGPRGGRGLRPGLQGIDDRRPHGPLGRKPPAGDCGGHGPDDAPWYPPPSPPGSAEPHLHGDRKSTRPD